MTANEFAEALRSLIGAAEDDGLERPEMIAALVAEVDEAWLAVEASPEGFAETAGLLVDLAEAAGLERAEVNAMLLDQVDAMRLCEAE